MLPAGVLDELKLNYVDCEACVHISENHCEFQDQENISNLNLCEKERLLQTPYRNYVWLLSTELKNNIHNNNMFKNKLINMRNTASHKCNLKFRKMVSSAHTVLITTTVDSLVQK
jgi:hypothetical protein